MNTWTSLRFFKYFSQISIYIPPHKVLQDVVSTPFWGGPYISFAENAKGCLGLLSHGIST